MDSNRLWMILAALMLVLPTGCISQIQNDGAEFAKAIETASCLEKATESSQCVDEDQNFYLDEDEEAGARPQLQSHQKPFRNVHSDVL